MPTPPPARTPTPTPPPARTSASTAPPHPSPLSGRLRPVDEYLRLLGLLLRPDWLESCTAALSPVGDLGVDDATGAFSVTTYDANHCPGEVKFLFEGQFDCTFSKCFLKLPSKESEIRHVVLCAV